MRMQEAINQSRFHNQWLHNEILMERGKFSKEIKKTIETLGYKILEREESIGRVEGVFNLARRATHSSEPIR